jgi:hypothetical protein
MSLALEGLRRPSAPGQARDDGRMCVKGVIRNGGKRVCPAKGAGPGGQPLRGR